MAAGGAVLVGLVLVPRQQEPCRTNPADEGRTMRKAIRNMGTIQEYRGDNSVIDYTQPRQVWTPGDSDPVSPWWGKIPKIITEGNDLTSNEKVAYDLLVTRQSGNRGPGYCDLFPHGEKFLAGLLGWQARTFKDVTLSLEDRGMIRITKDGEKTKHYEVLWAPQWRVAGDPVEKWNPPIRLGLQPVKSGSKSTANSGFDRMRADRHPSRHGAASTGNAANATRRIVGDANGAGNRAVDATRPCTKAGYEGGVVGDLQLAEDGHEVVDPCTGEIIDTDVPDTLGEVLDCIDRSMPEELLITVPSKEYTDSALAALRIIIADHPGETKVVLAVGRKKLRLTDDYRVVVGGPLFDALRGVFGPFADIRTDRSHSPVPMPV